MDHTIQNVYQMGTQTQVQKNMSKSPDKDTENPESVSKSITEGPVTKTDRVIISNTSTRSKTSEAVLTKNYRDAVEMIEDIKRKLEEEFMFQDQSLDQVHNLNSRDLVNILA